MAKKYLKKGFKKLKKRTKFIQVKFCYKSNFILRQKMIIGEY